jgi:hypothetical protein
MEDPNQDENNRLGKILHRRKGEQETFWVKENRRNFG